MQYIANVVTDGNIKLKYKNKKNESNISINQDLGEGLYSYSDFLDMIFYQTDINRIGKVDYQNGKIIVYYYDIENKSYTKYVNEYFISYDKDLYDEYFEFLSLVRERCNEFKEDEIDRTNSIIKKINYIDAEKKLANKAILFCEDYINDVKMDISNKEEIMDIYNYLKEHKEEVVETIRKENRSFNYKKLEDLFNFIKTGIFFSLIYSLYNQKVGLTSAISCSFVSFAGLSAIKDKDMRAIDKGINEMLYELRNIYDFEDNAYYFKYIILVAIDKDMDYINEHQDRIYTYELMRLDELKVEYKEAIKKKFETGIDIDNYYFAKKLAKIEVDLYFKYYRLVSLDESGIVDLNLRIIYDAIRELYMDKTDSYDEEIEYLKQVALFYLTGILSNDNCIDYGRKAVMEVVRINDRIEKKKGKAKR